MIKSAPHFTQLSHTMIQPRPQPQTGEAHLEIAKLFPAQGDWSEEEYLQLDTNQLVELSDRNLELLPMPTELPPNNRPVIYMSTCGTSRGPINSRLTLAAPFRVRLWKGKMRRTRCRLYVVR